MVNFISVSSAACSSWLGLFANNVVDDLDGWIINALDETERMAARASVYFDRIILLGPLGEVVYCLEQLSSREEEVDRGRRAPLCSIY